MISGKHLVEYVLDEVEQDTALRTSSIPPIKVDQLFYY